VPASIAYIATVGMTIRFLLRDCLHHLQDRGYEVAAVCSPGPWLTEVQNEGIPTYAVPMNRHVSPLADLRALMMLSALFRQQRFDIVHTHTPKANLLGRLAAYLSGVPVVCGTEHGFYFHGMSGPRRRFHRFWSECGTWCSDVTFLVNQEDVETAQRERIVPSHKLRVLEGGTGVDLDRFRTQGSRSEARQGLGIGDDTPVVGIVARLTREKGYLEFLRAAALVREHHPSARFLSIGPSDAADLSEFRELASQLGISRAVAFLGMRVDMPALYEAMDIVALPSHREGMPTTLMEAAAMERPVVATDIRGCRDVVSDGETGLLVPPRDQEALATAMTSLLSDPERRRMMGLAARRRAERLFDQQKVFAHVEAVYRQLLEQKGIC
jgi:glycosyltransferase involved in cell wall biosynthesis